MHVYHSDLIFQKGRGIAYGGGGDAAAAAAAFNRAITLQRGRGIGSFLTGLYSAVKPIFRAIVSPSSRKLLRKAAKRVAIESGVNVVKDALAGENILQSTKRNLRAAKDQIIDSAKDITALRKAKRRERKNKRRNPPGAEDIADAHGSGRKRRGAASRGGGMDVREYKTAYPCTAKSSMLSTKFAKHARIVAKPRKGGKTKPGGGKKKRKSKGGGGGGGGGEGYGGGRSKKKRKKGTKKKKKGKKKRRTAKRPDIWS